MHAGTHKTVERPPVELTRKMEVYRPDITERLLQSSADFVFAARYIAWILYLGLLHAVAGFVIYAYYCLDVRIALPTTDFNPSFEHSAPVKHAAKR